MYCPIYPSDTVAAPGQPYYLSEDWALCYRIKKKNYPIYAATKPSIKHHGTYAYTPQDAFKLDRQQGEKEKGQMEKNIQKKS